MSKDATLESLRVAIRKLENKVEPIDRLLAQFRQFGQKLQLLEQRYAAIAGVVLTPSQRRAVALPPTDDLPVVDAVAVAPAPAAPAAASAGLDVAELRGMFADLGRELASSLGSAIRDATGAAPVAGGVVPTVDDLNLDPRSVVAFEQPRG